MNAFTLISENADLQFFFRQLTSFSCTCPLWLVMLFWQLEAMGFDRALVLEVYFACNKNEELAANYLLDHLHEFDE